MVRFCSSKGDPPWVRTFKGANQCLLLQLRKNVRGRFIVFSLIGGSGHSRTIVFPEGSNALTTILKVFDLWASGGLPKLMSRSLLFKSRVDHHLSYGNVFEEE